MDTYKPKQYMEQTRLSLSSALLPSGKGRLDNRAHAQLKSIFMKTGVVHGAVGSAYFESDSTKVICAVYGPRNSSKHAFSEKGQLSCDFKW